MRTVLLLRHAKSSWDTMSLADYDRPLAKRGQKAAPLIGAAIARLDLKPDLILCSGAARTRETLALVLPALGSPQPEVVYDDAIYMATPATLMALLRKLPAPERPPKQGDDRRAQSGAGGAVGGAGRRRRRRTPRS